MHTRLAQSFSELNVYKVSQEFAMDIFTLSRIFPREEVYALTNQARRSSRAIGAAIAEAWGKRNYIAHFISKLTDVDAEQLETQHWILIAWRCGYIDVATRDKLLSTCQSIGRMLHAMMTQADSFCHHSPHSRTENRPAGTPTTGAPTHR